MSTKHPDISVVVVTYNRAMMLRQALESLINQRSDNKFSFEILVIDDGSTDDTAAVVRAIATHAKPLPVRYVYKEGGGEGDARNRGVMEARGDWIAFCDDDQLATPWWLGELYQAAIEKDAQCVGGSVNLLIPVADGIKLGPRARRILGEKWLHPHLASSKAKDCLGAGNLLVHRSVFDRVGGFDLTFRQGVDTDFFWKVERAGFTLGAAPKGLVYHAMTASRLRLEYLRRVCLRKGVATHRIHMKYAGPVRAALLMMVRLAIAFTVDLPLLFIGVISHDSTLVLGSRCRLWYKLGFIRAGLFALAPNVFRQTKFFQELDSGYHGAKREAPSYKT
jgi:glucosyl-dolichyl phosphate glucuronosyltransferase